MLRGRWTAMSRTAARRLRPQRRTAASRTVRSPTSNNRSARYRHSPAAGRRSPTRSRPRSQCRDSADPAASANQRAWRHRSRNPLRHRRAVLRKREGERQEHEARDRARVRARQRQWRRERPHVEADSGRRWLRADAHARRHEDALGQGAGVRRSSAISERRRPPSPSPMRSNAARCSSARSPAPASCGTIHRIATSSTTGQATRKRPTPQCAIS